MEEELSTSGSLTDLSSLSSEEGGSPSHRKYSSTSYIMKKKHTSASKTIKQASLSSTSSSRNDWEKNEDRCERGAEKKKQRMKLPHEPNQSKDPDRSTTSSLDAGVGRRGGAIPSIRVTSQDGEAQATLPTISESPNRQSNGLNEVSQLNGQEATPSHSQASQLNGSDRGARSVENGSGASIGVAATTHGHLFTEEEVQSLQRQIADLQVDLEQLLQYTHNIISLLRLGMDGRGALSDKLYLELLHSNTSVAETKMGKIQMLTQENNALKNILKDAVIVYDDDNMRQFCDTLLVSIHEQPLLRSGLDYDHLPSVAPPAKLTTLSSLSLQPSEVDDTSLSLRNERQQFSSKSAPVSPASTPSLSVSHGHHASSSHHHALEISLHNNKVTTFKTDPLHPETTTAKGSVKPTNGKGVSASQQAAESIKKLYDLTFTESEKIENQRQVEEKEKKLEGEEEVDCPENEKKETDTTTSSGPFLSFRKSFKMSQRHRESRKRCAKSEGSPELPHVASNPSRRRTIAGGKIEKPKFYLRDILPVLKERNQLKEQVHLLEDEVASLKSECGRLRVASNTWVNRHSWSGVLVDLPEEVPTLSASPPPDSKPSIAMRIHPAICDKEPYFTDAVVKDYIQRGPHKVYTVEVTRSDGQRFEIYRRYGEFFTFHHTLVQLFPPDVPGNFQPKNAVLPSLPSIENVLMKSHLKSFNKYCQILLTRMDSTISSSVFVTNFFAPSQKDKQLPRLTKPRAKSGFDTSDYFQMSINSTTAATQEEEYVLVADYVTDTEGELSVSAGDVVQLINREATGWWLVNSKVKEGELEKVGLVPGDFLKRYDTLVNENHPAANSEDNGIISSEAILGGIADQSMLHVAIEDYETEHPRQMSFSKGTQLVVIEVCEDGWWLAWAAGKEGWVPSSFLSPGTKLDDAADQIPNHWISPSPETTGTTGGGLKYITMAAFSAQNEADLTLPECAVVEVIGKSLTGWWKVSHGGSAGLVPASLLALTDANSLEADEISEEEKLALSIDLSHSVSGFVDPPLRSQRYLSMLGTTDQHVTS